MLGKFSVCILLCYFVKNKSGQVLRKREKKISEKKPVMSLVGADLFVAILYETSICLVLKIIGLVSII